MTTQDPELSAALGWPGGISDPVLDRKVLLQMVAALRLTSKQALEAWDGDEIEWFKRGFAVMENLRAALAQQDEPVKHQHKWFRTGAMEPGQMRCIDCGEWGKEQAEPVQDSGFWGRVAVRQASRIKQLETAAQQALDSINELFTAEQSEGGERSGHIRTPATREHLVRIAQARKALHESCGALRAALAQQDEPARGWVSMDEYKRLQGLVTSQGIRLMEYESKQPQQAEPVEPVAWVASKDGRVIYDDASKDDSLLRVSGDFENDAQRVRYAKRIVDKLNAAPPQRTMVPLTEGEIDALPWFGSPRQFARAVEKAAWEKNHG